MRSSIVLLHAFAVSSVSSAFTDIRPMSATPTPSSSSSSCVFRDDFIGKTSLGRRFRVAFAANEQLDDSSGVENLSKLTVLELKEKLRQLNLSVDGRKNELIERLHHHYLLSNSVLIGQGGEDMEIEAVSSTGIGSNESISEDLNLLTVPVLKERLRELGLPVGGRKAELMERLQSAHSDKKYDSSMGNNAIQITEQARDAIDRSPSIIVRSRSTLADTLDDLMGYEEEDEDNGDDQSPSPPNDEENDNSNHLDDEWSSGESASARRARRKKFWKMQEVRELIKSNDPSAATKAEEMIHALEEIAKQENDDNYLPGPIQYTLLIDAYAKSGTLDATKRAEDVIDRLLQANSGLGVSPTAQMMNAVMSTYANIGNVEAAAKATAILERMEYLKEFGQFVKPTIHSYSIAISAWAKCGTATAAQHTESILNRLFDDYDEVLSRGDCYQYAEELKPNNVVFNSVIDAWARSGSPNAGEKAEALLRRMETLSKMDKYDVRPDTITFNTCIKAWCNSVRQDAPLKAEEVLSNLEKNPQYPKRSGAIVTVRPNRLSYNTVINSWAKSQLPESALRSEALLLRMIKYYKSDTFATVSPDAVTFSSVLNALAKSEVVQFKAKKCSAILQAMVDLHEVDGSNDTRPNVICYNTVLNAAAFSARGSEAERRQALSVAVETFNQMKQSKYVSPDAVSYGHMLKACANLMPPGEQRNAIASKIFASCCEEGLVGGMCLDEIRRCIPPRAFLPLLAECGYDEPLRRSRKPHSVTLQELPREWTRHVAQTDMASRQRATFEKPKKTRKQKEESWTRDHVVKSPPVIPRPGLLVEYGASGRDL